MTELQTIKSVATFIFTLPSRKNQFLKSNRRKHIICYTRYYVFLRETIFVVKGSDLKIKTFHNRQNVSRETFYYLQLLNLN